MAFNGSGVYVRTDGYSSGATIWQNNAAAAINNTADRADTHDQDMADALSLCLTKDGQQTPTADLPMGGFHHTGVSNATALTNYGVVSQIQNRTYSHGGDSTGVADTFTVTIAPAPTAYADGQIFTFRAHQACVYSASVQINALAAKTLYRNEAGDGCLAGDIQVDQVCVVQYDSGLGSFVLLNPRNFVTNGNDVIFGTATDHNVIVRRNNVGQFQFVADCFMPMTQSDKEIGTASYRLKTVYSDAISSGSGAMSLSHNVLNIKLGSTTQFVFGDKILRPETAGDCELGSGSYRFHRCYLQTTNNDGFSYTSYAGTSTALKSIAPGTATLEQTAAVLNNVIRALRETEVLRS